MAKNVFKFNEILMNPQKVVLEPPIIAKVEEAAEIEAVEEYSGPTADDLRKEAELFKKQWEQEKAAMIAAAKAEAEKIIKEAEKTAFDEVKKKTDQALVIKKEAEETAKRILEEAQAKAADMEKEALARVEEIRNQARQAGFSEGHENGWKEGKAEVERLVDRLHVILNKAIEKRNEIIEESETQIINLVLLIAKKVIKVISENQKNVVVNNVIQALRKMKNRGDVVIRVNLADLALTTEHIKDFMRIAETVKSVTVMEDSTVERGGCIIETDFGQIDARISSQLREIEEKIVDLVPIKAKT